MYIRTRLALLLMFILVVVLVGFSVTIYQLTRFSLDGNILPDLKARAAMLVAALEPSPGSTTMRIPDLGNYVTPDIAVEVLDANHNVLAATGAPLKTPAGISSRLTKGGLSTQPIPENLLDNQTFRVYSQEVTANGQLVGYVVVARSPYIIEQVLNELERFLIPGTIIALLVGGLLGWLAVRFTLRPVERLAVSAAAIASSGDHAQRLPTQKPSDEIRRLAGTINGMLDALDHAYQEVRTANDLQRQFLADASHELRTPLTIMLSTLDVLNRVGKTDPQYQTQALADMRVEVSRMAGLVTQLLMLARTDEAATVAHQPLLLGEILADACRQAELAASGPTLNYAGLAPLEGAVVWGYPDHLKQLFLILLDNACKYTAADGRVEVCGQLVAGNAIVTVVDSGIGIPTPDLPKVFERFYRADNVSAYPGSGLGLTIAQRIAEQHSGTITLSSELGRGSCFTVTLPLFSPLPLAYLTTRNRRWVTPVASITRVHSSSIGSMPRYSNSRTPRPSRTGTRSIFISSSSPALRYCCAIFAPATKTFRSLATFMAFSIALSTPSVTKVNGAPSWGHSRGTVCVTTKTGMSKGWRPPHPLLTSNDLRPSTSAPVVRTIS